MEETKTPASSVSRLINLGAHDETLDNLSQLKSVLIKTSKF